MQKIIICLLTLLFLSSCSKQLNEEPKNIDAKLFYNTAAEAEAAVNAIFVPLRQANCLGGLFPAQLEAYGDYIYGRGSYAPLNEYTGLDNTNITRTGQIWTLFYEGIRNANLVIKNVPNASSIPAADISRYVAEARFMRGFIYFQMVRCWGGLPLRTETNMETFDVRRSTADDIYAFLLEDLKFAETNLPVTASVAGRPTRWSAKAVLADYYLTKQDWASARDKTEEIITSNRFSLQAVTVSSDYEKIFGPDVVTTPEEVFYFKFSRQGNNLGWQYVMFAHHPSSGNHGAGGFFGHYSDTTSNALIKNWDKADLRRSYNLYHFNIGLGAHSVLFRKFKDPVATTQYAAANDYPFYRYADVLMMNAEALNRINNGPTATAAERLSMIRRRAYGYPVTGASPVDYTVASNPSMQSFQDALVKERMYETMYEVKRWFELKRLGLVQSTILAVKGKTVATKHLLWPIPANELNYNKAMNVTTDQNPGY